jgi:signal transduction histidine kinase
MSSSTSPLRRILLGNAPFILSHAQFKRALLTGQLALITFVVCSGYLIFDLFSGVTASWPFQAACASMAFLSFLLNRQRRYLLAKVILAVAVNFTVFIFSSSEPFSTGLHSFYIATSLGALAGFGYEEKKWAGIFVLVSIGLSLISLLSDFQMLPVTESSSSYIKLNFTINLLVATIASLMIIVFLINVNHNAEKGLKESEQQLLKKNEELTKLNTELDRFVYSSSHDLKAPLASVMGLVQLAELSDDVTELKTYIGLMKSRVNDLDKFIKDISDYARNTRLAVDRQEVNLKRLVREVLESLKYFPESEKIEVLLEVPDDLNLSTDVTRLKMVMGNLISNSFKYSDRAKPTPFVRIHASKMSSRVFIEVEDNGIGIPKDRQSKIFDMFFQAHENSVGSGLGLYIVKETIEKIGGKIRVESTDKEGARFQVELPEN